MISAGWSQGQVTANGIRHHYLRTGGSRPPLLLLHGFLEGALAWLRVASALDREYDVIMVDARGHLIYQEPFDPFIALVSDFFAAH